jgi:phosphate uptake regulator
VDRILFQEGIADNLRFMVLEVTKQVENARKVLLDHHAAKSPGSNGPVNGLSALVESIEGRDDYIDNLKSVIENKCFSAIHSRSSFEKRAVDLLRAVNTVSTNLERIADFAVSVVAQTEYLQDRDFIARYNCGAFFKDVLKALSLVYQAVLRQDVSLAFSICRAESTLDTLYKIEFDRILKELRSGRETENLITSHLILRYLERMGDSLLNIGEAIIFAAVGEKFKIRQYEALTENLAAAGIAAPISDVEFQSIWGTRSGCRISKIEAGAKDGGPAAGGVLFKEGNRKKLLCERENIARWEVLAPGLPPRVLSYQEDGAQASLLLEFLGGCTFQDVVLGATSEIVDNALFLVEQTLLQVWDQTRTPGHFFAGYLEQLAARLDDVFRLYPNLRGQPKRVGRLEIPSLESLLLAAAAVERELPAPFTVFIHGDCNINNIVYEHESQRIHFIDLHRSAQSDPLQDIGVFLASLFRLPVFDPRQRAQLNHAASQLFVFARRYAAEHEDATFSARLALALSRNFVTSTRFELNPEFARSMFLRGAYLLERLVAHRASGQPWSAFLFRPAVFQY